MIKNTKTGIKKVPANHDKLSPRQVKALTFLLDGVSLQETAQRVGVARQTVSEWKNQHPAFKAKLHELRKEAEEELHFALPMNETFMLGQLRQVAAEGSHEIRLKAIQYFFERFVRADAGTTFVPNPLFGAVEDLYLRNRHRHAEN